MVKAPIVKEGYIYILFMLIIAFITFWLYDWWFLFPFAVMCFLAFFFRIPEIDDLIVSPADGMVMSVNEVFEEEYLNEYAMRVTIFLSVFDVHINRSPISGVICYQQYTCGRFKAAFLKSVGWENERLSIGIDNGKTRILVTQIAGLLARRIVSWVTLGNNIAKGTRYGMIKFGSCTELTMPLTVELFVKKGDKVRGGETIIGRIKQ